MDTEHLMDRLSTYIPAARNQKLPEAVTEKAKHHVLDTIAAMVSGSKLKTGELAIRFIRSQGGEREAQVVGTNFLTTAINAAMVNGFLAHADETDDSHAPSLTHPGCAIVPAALAMAERESASGEEFLRAVVLGYDISSRIARIMNLTPGRLEGHATHSIGPLFGSAAAASTLAKLTPHQVRYALAYTGQQASGITSWPRDEEHVEKAFVFAGMGGRNGVTSALFVQNGFTGEKNIFLGPSNFLDVYCPGREEFPKWIENLGQHFEISITNIKKFCVGSPIQAAADAMTTLVNRHGLTADNVKGIEIHLPPQGAKIVDDRNMPDINCQYIVAVILLDGKLTFKAAQSYRRMSDPKILDVKSRIKLIGDPQFAHQERERPGLVRVHRVDGTTIEEFVPAVRGTADNPMTRDEVETKAKDLLQEVLGQEKSISLIKSIWGLEKVKSMRELRPFLSA